MSWLSDMFGTSSINQNFNYDPALSDEDAGNQWTSSGLSGLGQNAQSMRGTAGGLLGMANTAMGQAGSFMDPNSEFYGQRRSQMSEDIGQGVADANMGMNRNLAARGMRSGGIRDLLAASNTGQIGEQVRQGSQDMYNQGIGFGQNAMSQAMQAQQGAGGMYQGAGGLMGQQAGIGQQMQQSLMNQAMFNAQQQNEQQQYSRTSAYNQNLSNQQRKGAFANSLLGSAAAIFNPFGAAAGAATGAV